LIILIVQHLLGVHVFSTSIVVASALLYVLIHIFDYSILGNKEHREHHEKARCNYAPDFMDVLAGTRCEPDAPYFNGNSEIIHAIVAVSVTYLLKNHFNWS
jgi:sterol desaturase/sphingolipid hydroxylase (fatty acid hydroxylase superfamily)